jgi:hypothetical protein
MRVYIYSLSDELGYVRYIGKTKYSLKDRLGAHIRESKKGKTHKCYWVRSLIKNNHMPTISMLEDIEEGDWETCEQYWISQFKTWGFRLVNQTDGGAGILDRSGEIYRKISSSNKNRIPWNKGKKMSKDFCKKISKAKTGVKLSQFHKDNISSSSKGRINIISDDTKEKISKTLKLKYFNGDIMHPMKNKTHSIESKNKMSLAKKGKKLSDDTKNKMRLKSMGGLNHKSVKIIQLDLFGNELNRFNSIADAVRLLNMKTHNSISNVIGGNAKTAYGFIWKKLNNNI